MVIPLNTPSLEINSHSKRQGTNYKGRVWELRPGNNVSSSFSFFHFKNVRLQYLCSCIVGSKKCLNKLIYKLHSKVRVIASTLQSVVPQQ